MKCVICGKEISNPYGFTLVGNNPYPVSDHGRCCDDCNMQRVIPARYAIIAEDKPAQPAEV